MLNGFLFADCRLGDHPRVRTTVARQDKNDLAVVAIAPEGEFVPDYGNVRLRLGSSLAGRIIEKRQSVIVRDCQSASFGAFQDAFVRHLRRYRSYLGVPLHDGEYCLGVLSFNSSAPDFFTHKHLGQAEALATILTYILSPRSRRESTPASRALGSLMRRIRESAGLTQNAVADRIGATRISVSRWESGSQSPSHDALFTWCTALGVVNPTPGALVQIVDVSARLVEFLKADPSRLLQLTPEAFETFVAERLSRMGLDVTLVGSTNLRDGGIDLIAAPKLRTVASFLLAGQVKHHRRAARTGRAAVDRLVAWKNTAFRLGLLVTNTQFTKDARWCASLPENRNFIRLRDFNDLQLWLRDNFWSRNTWREIPDTITVAPGITVEVPRPRIATELDPWAPERLAEDVS